jgi:hypothetical protein
LASRACAIVSNPSSVTPARVAANNSMMPCLPSAQGLVVVLKERLERLLLLHSWILAGKLLHPVNQEEHLHLVTRATKSRIADFAAPSFQEGSTLAMADLTAETRAGRRAARAALLLSVGLRRSPPRSPHVWRVPQR